MECHMAQEGSTTLIICGARGRTERNKRCVVCGTTYDLRFCDYGLYGLRAGETCSRILCATHAVQIAGKDYCLVHAALVKPPTQQALLNEQT